MHKLINEHDISLRTQKAKAKAGLRVEGFNNLSGKSVRAYPRWVANNI